MQILGANIESASRSEYQPQKKGLDFDRWLLKPWLGGFIFVIVMTLFFSLSIGIGGGLQEMVSGVGVGLINTLLGQQSPIGRVGCSFALFELLAHFMRYTSCNLCFQKMDAYPEWCSMLIDGSGNGTYQGKLYSSIAWFWMQRASYHGNKSATL